MARKSGWQNFADNFNAVYGTFNKVGQNIESKRIMDDEKFTAEGAKGYGLSGNALEKARYKALGDIYTKYGNADKGLAIRQQLSNLEATERANELEAATLQEQIRQRGLLQSALMQSQAYQNTASGNASNANANRTNQMTAGEVQALANQNRAAEQAIEFTDQTQDGRIAKTNIENEVSVGESANTIALQELDLEQRFEALNARIAQAKTEGDRAKLAGLETSAFLAYAQDYQNGKFGTEEEAKDAFVKTVSAFDPVRAKKLGNEYSAEEVSAIANDGLKIQGEIGSFLQTQDFNGLRKYFDDKNGSMYGVKLEVNDETGAVKMYEYDRGNNQTKVFVDAPDMATALEELQALSTFGNAGLYAETLAARKKADLAAKKTEAEIASLEVGTDHQNILNDTAKYSEILKQGNIAARTELAQAQVAQLKQETKSDAGLTWNDKAAQKAYNSFITSETYNMLADTFRDDPVGFDVYTNRVKMGLGLIKPPPADVSEEDWLKMTDADRALF